LSVNCKKVIRDIDFQLENLIACALLKAVHFYLDTQGKEFALHYLRNKDGKEVDFALVQDNEVATLIEVKWSDSNLSKNLSLFFKDNVSTRKVKRLQVVGTLNTARSWPNGDRAEPAIEFLSSLNLDELALTT